MATLPHVNPESITWRFSRAGGPGGQHVNTSSTRVELECDLALSGLAPAVLSRVIAALGPVVRIVVANTRSQHRNREIAEQRLLEMIAAASKPPKKRRPTKPSRGAVESRLDDKKRQAARKRERRPSTSWRNDE
ncbi:MAG: hypothetical protein RLY45_1368 [Actinomycetota bacterium]|jgi:ribosome-associated protein